MSDDDLNFYPSSDAGQFRVKPREMDDMEDIKESLSIDHSDLTVTVNKSSSDDDADDVGYLGVPDCPECGTQNAVQLSTDEWVCQESDCNEVYEL